MPNFTWDVGPTHIGLPCTRSQNGHNFVYKEHGSSKGIQDKPCESTSLIERPARMTKTQQIGHLKGKTTNPSILSLMTYVPYQKPAFMVMVELNKKQNGKETETWISCTCRQTPTLVKCQKMSDFLKAKTCMT